MHSHITSLEQAPLRVEITPDYIVLKPAITVALDELLDHRERRATAQATRIVDIFRVEEPIFRPKYQQSPSPVSQPGPLPMSAARWALGQQWLSPWNNDQGRNQGADRPDVKEKKDMVMPRLRDRASPPFALDILAVTVSPHVQIPQIDYYRGEGNPVEHIHRHKVSLLGEPIMTTTLRFFSMPTQLASPLSGSSGYLTPQSGLGET